MLEVSSIIVWLASSIQECWSDFTHRRSWPRPVGIVDAILLREISETWVL